MFPGVTKEVYGHGWRAEGQVIPCVVVCCRECVGGGWVSVVGCVLVTDFVGSAGVTAEVTITFVVDVVGDIDDDDVIPSELFWTSVELETCVVVRVEAMGAVAVVEGDVFATDAVYLTVEVVVVVRCGFSSGVGVDVAEGENVTVAGDGVAFVDVILGFGVWVLDGRVVAVGDGGGGDLVVVLVAGAAIVLV
eukprot:GFYU01048760.1.p2 GENE.GFYU01048760.1~~GFYU01048760.1.p2  ORF type:complete len:192 (-),score=11.60 GFYU01048760.1:324-899(-)